MNATNNEPKYTSEPRTPERDQEMIALAEKHFADRNGTSVEYFDFALQHGASLTLLERMADGFYGAGCMPSVDKMPEAGFTAQEVRQFTLNICTFDYEPNGCSGHRRHAEAFLANPKYWQVFDSVQSLTEILTKIGEPCGAQMLCKFSQIAVAFGRLRKPEIESEMRLAENGWRDMLVVMKAVAKHFLFVTDGQMNVLRSLPQDVQIEASWWVATNHVTIPWFGTLIARHFWRDRLGLVRRLDEKISQNPHCAPVIYRWYLLGVEADFAEIDRNPHRDDAYRQFPPEKVPELYRSFFLEREAHQAVRSDVERAGWKFATLVTEKDAKNPNFGALQVEFPGYDGTKIVIRHQNRELGQELKEGDEVIVSAKRPDDWAPVFEQKGRVRIYEAELQHAAPPTQIMQADPKKYFYLPDPKKDEQKK